MSKPNTHVEIIDGKMWQFTTVHYTETVGNESKEGVTLCGLPTDELILYHDAALFLPSPFPGVKKKRHVIDGCADCMTEFFEAFKKVEFQRDMWQTAAHAVDKELETKNDIIDMLKRAVRRNQRKADALGDVVAAYENGLLVAGEYISEQNEQIKKLSKKKGKKTKKPKYKVEDIIARDPKEIPQPEATAHYPVAPTDDIGLRDEDEITVCDVCVQNHPGEVSPDPDTHCPLCAKKGIQHVCSARLHHLNEVMARRRREDGPSPSLPDVSMPTSGPVA